MGSTRRNPIRFRVLHSEAEEILLLTTLRLGAIALGVATGALVAALATLTLGGALALLGMTNGPGVGLTAGVVAGLFLGGFAAGRLATHSHRFHGAVTGIGLAAVVVVIARLGGSPASTITVLWLALVAVAVGSVGGVLGGRKS